MTARNGAASAGKVVAVCLGALAWARPGAGETGPCELMVSSRPKGATVSVDDKERGRTPLIVKGLSVGEHTVRVVLEGHSLWIKKIRFRPGPRIVRAELEKREEPAPPADTAGGPSVREEPVPAGRGRTKQEDGPPAGDARREPPEPAPDDEGKLKKRKIPRTIDVPCPCCEGDGLINEIGCTECRATGVGDAADCPSCQGKTRVAYDCPGCQGTGKIARRGKEADCPLCRGRGAPSCPACKGKGTVRRPNPEAMSYATTPCISCDGDGCEKSFKCRVCTGKGKLTRRGTSSLGPGYVLFVTFACPFCGGDGKSPDLCQRCDGRGYLGPIGAQRIVTPCTSCGGRGYLFHPCRTCRGMGWHRSR